MFPQQIQKECHFLKRIGSLRQHYAFRSRFYLVFSPSYHFKAVPEFQRGAGKLEKRLGLDLRIISNLRHSGNECICSQGWHNTASASPSTIAIVPPRVPTEIKDISNSVKLCIIHYPYLNFVWNQHGEVYVNPLLKPEGPTSYRYVIFAIVTILALVNYIDRGAISYASGQIIGEYGFSRADWGSMLGYFGYGYMFGAILGGTLSDKLGARKLWIIAGTAWSIVAVSMIWAGELGILAFGGSALAGFAVVRILFGFSEGPAYSIINKTMGNWAPRSERGLPSPLAF